MTTKEREEEEEERFENINPQGRFVHLVFDNKRTFFWIQIANILNS